MKRELLIVFIVMCILVTGCNNTAGKYSEKEIEKVMVYYEKEGNGYSVWIYMDTHEREMSIYSDPVQETNDKYNYVDELNIFIKENILTENIIHQDDIVVIGKQDEQKNLWSMKIRFTDNTTINFSSFTEYPQFWDEFVELIER